MGAVASYFEKKNT